MKITNDDLCNLCIQSQETISHLFTQCPQIKVLWSDISKWIHNTTNYNIKFDQITIICGYLLSNNIQTPINTIILATKSYIFWCSRHKRKPNIYSLQKQILDLYNTQLAVASINNNLEYFNKKWTSMIQLITNLESS